MDEVLKIGTTLDLELITNDKREKFKTTIAGVNGNEILVEIPINEETKKFGFFYLNTIFQAFYYVAEKVYQFDTELLRRVKDNIPLLVLSFPGEENLRVIQRRQHVRVESTLDVAVHPVNGEFSPFSTVTLDISGGGMAVHLSKDYGLKPHQEVDIWVVLPMMTGQYAYCKIRCTVIRQFYVGDYLRASVQFSDISKNDYRHLVKYTLDRDLYYKKLTK